MDRQINPRMLQSEPIQRCKLHVCNGACCLHGVWLDLQEVQVILQNTANIAPHMPAALQDPGLWFVDAFEPDPFLPSGQARHCRVMHDPSHYGNTSCVFFRDDHKCALQTAATAKGLHPWTWKPFYCVLHPLDLDDQGHITLDETHPLLEEPGSCLVPSPTPVPLWLTFEEELRFLLGDEAYQQLNPDHP